MSNPGLNAPALLFDLSVRHWEVGKCQPSSSNALSLARAQDRLPGLASTDTNPLPENKSELPAVPQTPPSGNLARRASPQALFRYVAIHFKVYILLTLLYDVSCCQWLFSL